jgi:DDE superfamily endonuclease
MLPLPETIILVLAPFAPLFSQRVWGHAQVLLLGAMLSPGARTVTAALRVMGCAAERHFTNDQRVLNRARWSARQGSRILLGLLITLLVPPGATIVLGADDTVERRSGRKITAKGCYRDAVRSTKKHMIRCFGLKWVSMMLLVPVPWSRRVCQISRASNARSPWRSWPICSCLSFAPRISRQTGRGARFTCSVPLPGR